MEEKIIPLSLAKILKEIGFNYNPEYYFFPKDDRTEHSLVHKKHYWPRASSTIEEDYLAGKYTLVFPAPTWSQLQTWLRKEKKINIWVEHGSKGTHDLCISGVGIIRGSYRTYEDALENGVSLTIEKLKI